jgi:Dimerisation domain
MNRAYDPVKTASAESAPAPGGFMLDTLRSFWEPRALWAAARLRLADAVGETPRTVEEVAEATRTEPVALRRLLNALAAAGIFRRHPDGRFASTPISDMLRSDRPDSQRALIEMILGGEVAGRFPPDPGDPDRVAALGDRGRAGLIRMAAAPCGTLRGWGKG